jgi:uncharacterized DUF497 family protein
MIKFEWDDEKAKATWRERGVSFDDAATVFSDPNAIFRPDDYKWEDRIRALGFSRKLLLLLVVHTERRKNGEEVIRIISARKATPTEWRQYGNRKL